MRKQIIEGAGHFYYQYPRLAVIVTSHSAGKDNAMAVAWHSPLSMKPPLYGVAITSSRTTYDFICEGKGFGVNFLPVEKAEYIAATGGSKGKDIDKFERFNIAKDRGVKTYVPLIKDAYAAYECKLVECKTYGDHEWVVGEIVATHVIDEAYSSQGLLDIEKYSPSLYLGGDVYATVTKDTMKHLDRKEYGGK